MSFSTVGMHISACRASGKGFTLAELLVCLAILGVIATFTIPKVLQAQKDSRNNAIVKEAAASISDAFQQYRYGAAINASTPNRVITPYLNYVSIATSGTIDNIQTQGTLTCGPGQPCYLLHNGAILLMCNNCGFGGTAATNALSYFVDPDGKVTTGSTTGPGKSVRFYLYPSGRIASIGTVSPNTVHGLDSPVNPTPSLDPPWFSWNN